MFCSNCGTQIPETAKFCGQCGQVIAAGTPAPEPMPPISSTAVVADQEAASQPTSGRTAPLLVAGVLVGGFIGFLMRPSVILIGQLPFETVITRGAGLSGIDQLLVPAAEQSFNVMMAGAVAGAAGGFGLSRLLAKRRT